MSETASAEPGQIEEDLAHVRARLDSRLNELQDRLAPRQIAGDVVDYLRGSGGADFVRNFLDTARRNPVPMVLAGVGLAWLMATQNGTTEHMAGRGHYAPPTPEGGEPDAPGYMNAALDKFSDTLERNQAGMAAGQQKAREQLHDVRDTLAGGGGQVASMARGLWTGGGSLASGIAAQPLALGALGLTVGAILGLVLPASGTEAEALGGVAAQARERVRGTAREAMARGREAASQVMENMQPDAPAAPQHAPEAGEPVAGEPIAGEPVAAAAEMPAI